MPEEPETVEVEPSESEVIETAEPVFDEVEEDESEFSSFDDGFETLDEEGSVDINSLFGCEGNQVPSKRTSSERNSGGADPEANGDGEEYSGEDEGCLLYTSSTRMVLSRSLAIGIMPLEKG